MHRLVILFVLVAASCARTQSASSVISDEVRSYDDVRVSLSWNGAPCSDAGDLGVSIINGSGDTIRLPVGSGIQHGQMLAIRITQNGDAVRSDQLGILPYSPAYLEQPRNIKSIKGNESYKYNLIIGGYGGGYYSVISEQYSDLIEYGGTIQASVRGFATDNTYGLYTGSPVSNVLQCPARLTHSGAVRERR